MSAVLPTSRESKLALSIYKSFKIREKRTASTLLKTEKSSARQIAGAAHEVISSIVGSVSMLSDHVDSQTLVNRAIPMVKMAMSNMHAALAHNIGQARTNARTTSVENLPVDGSVDVTDASLDELASTISASSLSGWRMLSAILSSKWMAVLVAWQLRRPLQLSIVPVPRRLRPFRRYRIPRWSIGYGRLI